jgi:hypothetical protein
VLLFPLSEANESFSYIKKQEKIMDKSNNSNNNNNDTIYLDVKRKSAYLGEV